MGDASPADASRPSESRSAERRHAGLAAAALPPVFAMFGGGALIVGLAHESLDRFSELPYLVGGAAFTTLAISGLGLVLAKRETRIPVALPLAVGLLPGLAGLFLMVVRSLGFGLSQIYDENWRDPAFAIELVGEAATANGVACALAGPTLLGLALGLAIGARAAEGAERELWPGALASVFGAGAVLALTLRLLGPGEWTEAALVVPALVATGVLALSGASIGREGRSGPLAVGAGACAMAGLTLTVLAMRWLCLGDALQSALQEPTRAMMLERAARADTLVELARWCAASAGLGALVLAGVTARTRRRWLGSLTLASLALSPALIDAAATRGMTFEVTRSIYNRFVDAPPGFEPTPVAPPQRRSDATPGAYATVAGLAARGSSQVAPWGDAAGLARLLSRLSGAPEHAPGHLVEASWESAPAVVSIAVDARLDADAVTALFEAQAAVPGRPHLIQLLFADNAGWRDAAATTRSPLVSALAAPRAVPLRVAPMHPAFDAALLREGFCETRITETSVRHVCPPDSERGGRERIAMIDPATATAAALAFAVGSLHSEGFLPMIATREPPSFARTDRESEAEAQSEAESDAESATESEAEAEAETETEAETEVPEAEAEWRP